MIDREAGDGLGWGEADIDGGPQAAVRLRAQGAR